MLNGVIRFALRYRLLIIFLSLAVLIYGGFTAATLPIDVLPDLDRPRVVIMTEAPGFAPEDVETLITFPLESTLNGATGVESVRSQSGPSLSVIYVDFGWETDIFTARQIVQERIRTAELPEGISAQMSPISSIMGQIMIVGMHRLEGPRGGALATISESEALAELLLNQREGAITLALWLPRDEGGNRTNNPRQWQPVEIRDTSLSLTWSFIGMEKPPEPITIRLNPTEDKHVHRGEHPRLKELGLEQLRASQQEVVVPIEGEQHRVVFPTFLQRQMELRTLADWVVRLRLLKIGGVAQVVTMGGEHKQYQVLVDPRALHKHQVSLEQVTETLQRNNLVTSGGWLQQGDKELPVRFLGRLGPEPEEVLADLRKIPIKGTEKRNVLLSQVARVVEGPEIKRGDASINGKPGVAIVITKQPHVDTREVTEKVTVALSELEASLPPDIVLNPELFQLKKFIDLGIFNVGEALVLGAGLVILVLFLFLLNFRTTFISLTAIPLSLMITAIVFRLVSKVTGTELSINVMTLGGIAVAMGELVDDAIVDVENIFRRLRENNVSDNPKSSLRVIYEASLEIRSAIVFGTMMVILVFLPLFALSGIAGRLFAPLGVAYIVSILASLLISLTVTPVLSYYLLPKSKATHREKDSLLLRLLKRGASYLIRFSMRFAGLLLLFIWVVVGACALLLTTLGTKFLPNFDEGSVQVNIILPPGSSIKASNETTALVDEQFRAMMKTEENPDGEILNFVRRTGRAELDEHAEPVSNTEYILSMNPENERNRLETITNLLEELKELKLGADVEVEQPLQHLINHMLTGVTAQIAIKIYGDDLQVLRQTAERVKQAIQDIEGISPPVVEAQQLVEELHVKPREDALSLHNVDRAEVGNFVHTALYGKTVSQIVENERRYDLIVRLDEPYRSDRQNLDRLLVRREGDKEPLMLGMLADIDEELGPNMINRENVRRRIILRVNALDRDLGSVVNEIQRRVREEVRLPQGYFVEYGGQFESQKRATFRIAVLSGVAVVGMFVLLSMLYPSWRIVLQILNALPTAFIGGVLALWISGQTLTVASMVGFISLGGIAARNGILLVSHYFHLMKEEGESFSDAMVLRGSLERLSPVLMTALTAGFALIPLVIAGQEPGREILYPVATVILGGLITSTLCEFLIHPGLFRRFSGRDAEQLTREEQDEWGPMSAPETTP